MVNQNNPALLGIRRILSNAGFGPNRECYCGCGEGANADRHFASSGGHDLRFTSAFLGDTNPEVSELLEEAVRVHLANRAVCPLLPG